MHILLATTGYPPEHAGAGGRLHQMYVRLAVSDPSFSWSVLTKSRDSARSRVEGPRKIATFCRGGREYPSAGEAISEVVWTARRLRSGLMDGVDLVHAAGWTFGTPLLAWAAQRRGIPLIREMTTIGDVGSKTRGSRLIRWTNRQADEIVAISPALAQAVKQLSANRIPVWCRPNGIDTARFCLPDTETRGQRRNALCRWLPTLTDSDILVLHVGRIRPLKNQMFLADCVARLPSHVKLLLVGPIFEAEQSYADTLRQRLAAVDLAGRAAWIEGNTPGIERFMQGADIFALPSTTEGLGTVMLEALCCGLPVVASRLVGVTDWIITEGVNGYLAPLDVDQFATRIAAAATLMSERQRIRAAAAARFDCRATDAGYQRLFARLLDRI